MIFLNKKSEEYHKIMALIDQTLIMVCSENYDNKVMTKQAYQIIRSAMDKCDYATHIAIPIGAESAARLGLSVLTVEDVSK